MHNGFKIQRDQESFDACISWIIKENEGGFSSHPKDPGGATMYGITQKTAQGHGYKGRMQDLSYAIAVEIYRKNYWPDMFDYLPRSVAFHLLDCSINHGASRCIKTLQSMLGVKDDGIFGEKTFNALININMDAFIMLFCLKRIELYSKTAGAGVFSSGWNNRILKNLRHTGQIGAPEAEQKVLSKFLVGGVEKC